MVEKARRIVEDLGGQIASPREARDLIGLPTRLAAAKQTAVRPPARVLRSAP